ITVAKTEHPGPHRRRLAVRGAAVSRQAFLGAGPPRRTGSGARGASRRGGRRSRLPAVRHGPRVLRGGAEEGPDQSPRDGGPRPRPSGPSTGAGGEPFAAGPELRRG